MIKKLKEGDKFYAVIKKGVYSLTLVGEEKAWTFLGPFIALKDANNRYILAEGRIFLYDRFTIVRA